MNIFILSSGRCGSTTFMRACQHIDNYSTAHESRLSYTGAARLDYPPQHIESDNRLSWLLGRLDQAYGQSAFYVHLQRDPAATIASFVRRYDFGIMKAYREGILLDDAAQTKPEALAEDYLTTVNQNIALFLKDKPLKMNFQLEQAQADFPLFWQQISAKGNLQAALAEWQVKHNATMGC